MIVSICLMDLLGQLHSVSGSLPKEVLGLNLNFSSLWYCQFDVSPVNSSDSDSLCS